MRTTRMVPALLLAVAAVTVSARPAAGQARLFEVPDIEADLSTYTSIFDCMGAVDRVAKALETQAFHDTKIWPDTMPRSPEDAWHPWPAAVGETARTCLEAAAEDVASGGAEAWSFLAGLYLHAGMEDSARAVVERRLAAVEPDSTEELRKLLSDVLGVYKSSRLRTRLKPPQLAMGDEIVLEHVGKLPTLDERLKVYMQMLVSGSDDPSKDTRAAARTRQLLARIQTQLDSITEDDAQRLAAWGLGGGDVRITPEKIRERLEGFADFFFGQSFRLKDLRVSTQVYAEATRKAWGQANGEPPEAYNRPVGQRAPALEGDVWLGCEQEPCESYPRPGRVSLVVFHTPETTRSRAAERPLPFMVTPGAGCASRAIPLRRLQDQFPDLDIIIVTRTWGQYHYTKEGVTPEREAELMYECFKSHGLDRAVLTMTKTPGWRLPEPDGRWVEQPMANWTNYSFGGIWHDGDRRQHGSDLIVDQDGYVIHTSIGRVAPGAEKWFAEFIEILLEREKGTT